jgi:hypothetical protein
MSDRSPDQIVRALFDAVLSEFDVVLSRECGNDMTYTHARALVRHLNELGLEEKTRELQTALAKEGVFEIISNPRTGDWQSITGDLYRIRQTVYRLKVACLEQRGEPADLLAANVLLENFKKRILSPQNADKDADNLPTIWYHGEKSYSTDGNIPVIVSSEQHNLLKAFLDGKIALDTEALSNKGVCNVAAVVDKIVEQFGAGPVRRPGRRKGSGYYIRVRTLKKSN